MSEVWISEPNIFDFENDLYCEKTGYCDPKKCKYVKECWSDQK